MIPQGLPTVAVSLQLYTAQHCSFSSTWGPLGGTSTKKSRRPRRTSRTLVRSACRIPHRLYAVARRSFELCHHTHTHTHTHIGASTNPPSSSHTPHRALATREKPNGDIGAKIFPPREKIFMPGETSRIFLDARASCENVPSDWCVVN